MRADKMRLHMLAVTAVLAFMPWPAHAVKGWSGNDMLWGCNAVVQEMDSKTPTTPSIEAFRCMGFVEGYLSGHINAYVMVTALQTTNLGEADLYKTIRELSLYCVPGSATSPQVMRVFVRYMKNNPKELHEPAHALLSRALEQSFPCRK